MNFCVVNLGCRVNRTETDSVAAALLAQGNASVAENQADLIVVNTCTVTGEADKKARKAVRHALSASPHAQVVVTGCAAAIEPQEFQALSPRVQIVPKAELEQRVAHIQKTHRLLRIGEDFHTRVNLKIQDGCDHNCSYCIVHVARGKARSLPAKDVVSAASAYAQRGVREIVLTGINLATYRDGNVDLAALLRMLLEATESPADGAPACRFRLSSVEPIDLGANVVDVMAEADGRICRHLHMALQSGSNKVLAEMNRPYDANQFLSLVSDMRARMPQLSLSTDVIVGFPGETDEDFQETLDLCRACAFSKIHVFPYSMRAGTPAALRADQIPPEVKKSRAARLRALSRELRQADYANRVGTVEMVLVEPDYALTESYHEVRRPLLAQIGDLVPLVLAADAQAAGKLSE